MIDPSVLRIASAATAFRWLVASVTPLPARYRARRGGRPMPATKDLILARPPPLRHAHVMSDLALSLRLARPADAAPLARVYVEAWHDTYAAILPHNLLAGMSVGVHTAR